MKIAVALICLSPLSSQLRADDLFYNASRPQTVARSLAYGGKTYGNVTVAGYDGKNVLLKSKQGDLYVPLSSVPKLWQDAITARSWPGPPSPTSKSGVWRTPGATKEWSAARSEALTVVRKNAEDRWRGDFEMQAYEIEKQMQAWEKLHPVASFVAPAVAKSQAETLPPAEEIKVNTEEGLPVVDFEAMLHDRKREADALVAQAKVAALQQWPEDSEKREKFIAAFEETAKAIVDEVGLLKMYDEARADALKAAEENAKSSWPNDAPEREARVKRLMTAWDRKIPKPHPAP